MLFVDKKKIQTRLFENICLLKNGNQIKNTSRFHRESIVFLFDRRFWVVDPILNHSTIILFLYTVRDSGGHRG